MRSLPLVAAGAVVLGSLVGVSAPAHATPAPAPASVSTVTLPLFGAPLVVDVTTDAGGGLVGVALNPADEYTATKIKPNRVMFVNEAGTVRVRVSARHGGQRVVARAGELADVSGPGGWSGDVFETGETTTVGFTVAAAPDGGPDITGVTVESPAAFVIGETRHDKDSDDDRAASVAIEFSNGGQSRVMRISVVVATDDGRSAAKLKIGLSRVVGRQLAIGDAIGAHTWRGRLCDGTAAAVDYVVTDDGRITDVVAVPDAGIDVSGRRAAVRFSARERVSIAVRGGGEKELTVGVAERIRCERADPTVNTDVEQPADDDGEDDDSRGQGRDERAAERADRAAERTARREQRRQDREHGNDHHGDDVDDGDDDHHGDDGGDDAGDGDADDGGDHDED